jgi:hypothetical protein
VFIEQSVGFTVDYIANAQAMLMVYVGYYYLAHYVGVSIGGHKVSSAKIRTQMNVASILPFLALAALLLAVLVLRAGGAGGRSGGGGGGGLFPPDSNSSLSSLSSLSSWFHACLKKTRSSADIHKIVKQFNLRAAFFDDDASLKELEHDDSADYYDFDAIAMLGVFSTALHYFLLLAPFSQMLSAVITHGRSSRSAEHPPYMNSALALSVGWMLAGGMVHRKHAGLYVMVTSGLFMVLEGVLCIMVAQQEAKAPAPIASHITTSASATSEEYTSVNKI